MAAHAERCGRFAHRAPLIEGREGHVEEPGRVLGGPQRFGHQRVEVNLIRLDVIGLAVAAHAASPLR